MSRSMQSNQLAVSETCAELLLEVGRRVRKHIRYGAAMADVAKLAEFPVDYCQLALAFACASDLVKLRASVEDWPWERIARELETESVEVSRQPVAFPR